jgi:hypothetical protein
VYAERLAIEWSYVSKAGTQRPRYVMIVLEVAIKVVPNTECVLTAADIWTRQQEIFAPKQNWTN